MGNYELDFLNQVKLYIFDGVGDYYIFTYNLTVSGFMTLFENAEYFFNAECDISLCILRVSYMKFYVKVNIQPRPHSEIAGSLLSEVNDPSSNYSQLVASGDIQVVLSYTYTKASLINIPPDEVRSCIRQEYILI